MSGDFLDRIAERASRRASPGTGPNGAQPGGIRPRADLWVLNRPAANAPAPSPPTAGTPGWVRPPEPPPRPHDRTPPVPPDAPPPPVQPLVSPQPVARTDTHSRPGSAPLPHPPPAAVPPVVSMGTDGRRTALDEPPERRSVHTADAGTRPVPSRPPMAVPGRGRPGLGERPAVGPPPAREAPPTRADRRELEPERARPARDVGSQPIEITIDRVDVRVTSPEPRGPGPPRAPRLSLEEYLAARDER
jgi:hypothetical protein